MLGGKYMTLLEAKMRVENSRERMNKAIKQYGLESHKALIASKNLDKELNLYETIHGSFER